MTILKALYLLALIVVVGGCERALDCREKTKPHIFKHTKGCKIINNFSPTGRKTGDDCGRLIWAYSTIECDGYKYFGWQTWNNSKDDKNVWIEGNQFYRSCQWPKGIRDEKLKSEDCKYNFTG